MRPISAMFLTGILSLGLGVSSYAGEVIPRKAGDAVINLPSDWVVFPGGVADQFSSKGGPNILLLAEGPAEGFPKLTILKNPDSTTQKAFRKLNPTQVKALCEEFNGSLEEELSSGAAEAACVRVENGGVPALATRMVIPAEGERPELVSMTWSYPNGDKGLIATAMFLSKDVPQFESTIRKAFESVRFDN